MSFYLLSFIILSIHQLINCAIIKRDDNFLVFANNNEKDKTVGIVIGVGTAVSTTDYTSLSNTVVSQVTNSLFITLDDNPGFGHINKSDPVLYVKAFNKAKDWTSSNGYSIQKWFVGGHSGSGQGAADALTNNATFASSIEGYVGFDPYCVFTGLEFSFTGPKCVKKTSRVLNKPSLIWSFKKESCGVDPVYGGVGFYQYATNSVDDCQIHNHALYTLTDNSQHCIFTDSGCPFLGCGPKNKTAKALIDSAIAVSIQDFITNDFDVPSQPYSFANYTYKPACPPPKVKSFVALDEDKVFEEVRGFAEEAIEAEVSAV
eukprot:gene17591-23161_t